MGRVLAAVVLGLVLDAMIWPVTSDFWREVVHAAILEQKADSGWAAIVGLTVVDGVLAVLIVVGSGIGAAVALVQAFAGRRSGW